MRCSDGCCASVYHFFSTMPQLHHRDPSTGSISLSISLISHLFFASFHHVSIFQDFWSPSAPTTLKLKGRKSPAPLKAPCNLKDPTTPAPAPHTPLDLHFEGV